MQRGLFHAKISSLNSDEWRSQQIEIVAIFLRVMLYRIYLQNLSFQWKSFIIHLFKMFASCTKPYKRIAFVSFCFIFFSPLSWTEENALLQYTVVNVCDFIPCTNTWLLKYLIIRYNSFSQESVKPLNLAAFSCPPARHRLDQSASLMSVL